jgi:hypothetical protein
MKKSFLTILIFLVVASFSINLFNSLANNNEAKDSLLFFPIIEASEKWAPTATPTRTPTPIPTPVPSPTPYPVPPSMGDCSPSDPNYRDPTGNGPYKFCVAKDLSWVDLPSSNSVQYFTANSDRYITVEWNVYGISGIRLAADPSTQIQNCAPAGNNGFNIAVNGNGNHTFNLKALGVGQYKLELYITRNDNVVVGHNEIFLCLK